MREHNTVASIHDWSPSRCHLATRRASVQCYLSCLPSSCRPVARTPAKEDYGDLRGVNYVPSYARNDVAIWMDFDPVVIERELAYANTLGLNCVRVFLQYAVYEHDSKRFCDNLEMLLQLCDRHGIRLMPVVFDSCFGEFPDLANYRDKDWMACPGQNRLGAQHWPQLEQYVRDVIVHRRDDRRIVMWDVMNEPECTSYWQDANERDKIWTFLKHMLEYSHSLEPAQPLTVGLMTTRKYPQGCRPG